MQSCSSTMLMLGNAGAGALGASTYPCEDRDMPVSYTHLDSWFYGLGFWTRGNAEICLLATKGHPKRQAANIHQFIISTLEAHSLSLIHILKCTYPESQPLEVHFADACLADYLLHHLSLIHI